MDTHSVECLVSIGNFIDYCTTCTLLNSGIVASILSKRALRDRVNITKKCTEYKEYLTITCCGLCAECSKMIKTSALRTTRVVLPRHNNHT